MNSDDENFCSECYKQYPNSTKYQYHIRMKHREGKQQPKEILSQENMHDIEDRVYNYFGELSETYADALRPPEQQNMEQPRFIGQANYLTNLAVRTPYENEINVVESIPVTFQFRPKGQSGLSEQQEQSLTNLIKEELGLLCQKLNEQRNIWQFADPYDPKTNFQQEFSIFDLRKLVKNYPKKNLNLRFPELTIFLAWIARICKTEMFQLTYSMLVSYTLCYEAYCKKQNLPLSSKRNIKNWFKFMEADKYSSKGQVRNQDQNSIRSFVIVELNGMGIKKLQKLLDLYDSWMSIVIPGLFMNKKVGQESESHKVVKQLQE